MRSATRVVASTLGVLVGLAGIDHGFFEVLQGNRGAIQSGGEIIVVKWEKSKRRRRMRLDRAEKKATLMREAERLIEELLDWEGQNEAPNLGEIEEEILVIREEFGQQMLKSVLSHQVSIQPVPGPSCPGCGQEMRYKGRKGKQVESLAGGLKVERGYYYCEGCRVGIFPPG
jgi:hypothetical protein